MLEDELEKFKDAKEELAKVETKEGDKEVVAEVSKEPEVSEQVDDKPSYTESEQKAIDQGWKPQAEFKGDNWVSADEFLRVGSILKVLKQDRAEAKKLREQNEHTKTLVKELLDHNKKLEKVAYEKAYAEVMKARADAVENGDTVAFNNAELRAHVIADQMQKIEQGKEIAEVVPEIKQDTIDVGGVATKPTEAVIKFKEQNGWLNENDQESVTMREEFTDYVRKLTEQDSRHVQETGKGLYTEQQALEMIEVRMKKLFPSRFEVENPNRAKPIAVARSSSSTVGKAESELVSRMTEQQRWIFKQAKAVDSTLNIEQYATQLEATGALRNE